MLPLSSRLANALVSYVTYLGQLFCPAGLAVFYPHPETRLAHRGKWSPHCWCWWASPSGALAGRRRNPYLLVGWLWYLGMLVPVIGLVQVGAAGDGRPLHLLAADWAMHRLGLGNRAAPARSWPDRRLGLRHRLGAGGAWS